MSNIGKRLNLVLSTIIKQKRIHGLFNLEGIIEVISRLEPIDVQYEKKTTICRLLGTIFLFAALACFIILLQALTRHTREVSMGVVISLIVGIGLKIMAWRFSQFNLDDEFKTFFKSALVLLKDRIKPNAEMEINLELTPYLNRKFHKPKGPTYEEYDYISSSDNFYERDVGYITIPFSDGNIFTLAEKELTIITYVEDSSDNSKSKVERRKHFFHTLRLQVNNQKYQCKPLPPDTGNQAISSAVSTTLYNETIKHSRTDNTDILEMSYTVKFDDPDYPFERMVVDAFILPELVHKLYTYLTFMPERY